MYPARHIRRVVRGILKMRAASKIVTISFFLIADIANKTLPSCSTADFDDLGIFGRMAGG